ncbi:PREDICTED: rap guanine nucleotide exchange factor-like 1 [Nipponia nippon]|uniref:rap guanine nucleotide exchange factor-like 1 n=1 Tax=Nipponia nippon TaxID=128390 RepID=UPI0005112169|nr:PREDICTED: rap guanine nucleotide exchange factor-like 1 [Nipponia nippon]
MLGTAPPVASGPVGLFGDTGVPGPVLPVLARRARLPAPAPPAPALSAAARIVAAATCLSVPIALSRVPVWPQLGSRRGRRVCQGVAAQVLPCRRLCPHATLLPGPGCPAGLGAESLLDDIVLTHSLFLPTERFLQQLHQQYPWGARGAAGGRWGAMRRHQLVETVELKVADETPPPNKQVKPLFRHFRRIDSCLQTRVAFRGSDEIFCRVYMPDHSYVTIRSRLSASVQDILTSVTEKLQYSEEQSAREDALILVTMASSGEKAVLQPSEECVFTTLGINSHLFACTRDTFDSLVPLPEEIQVVPGDTEIHRAEPEEIANHLTAFHWELFRCIHELEFVDYVFHGERGRRGGANLKVLLSRCSAAAVAAKAGGARPSPPLASCLSKGSARRKPSYRSCGVDQPRLEFHLGILLSLPRDSDLCWQTLRQLTASTQGGRLELETGCLLPCKAAGASPVPTEPARLCGAPLVKRCAGWEPFWA